MPVLALVVALAPAARAADPPAAGDALAGMAAAERAFSALSVEKGMKDAFLGYLAEGGIIFRPGPVDGRKVWEARPASPPGTLIWEPEFGEVSAFGDLGVSTGPWEYRPKGQTDPDRYGHGHFISIWKRPPGGEWRVALDLGIDHPRPAHGGLGEATFTPGPQHPRVRVMRGGPTGSQALERLDAALGKASRSGLSAALAHVASADLRFNRSGALPHLGLAAARAAIDTLAGRWDFSTRGSGVAVSQDLAYTYGLAMRTLRGAAAPADTSVYLNVWRRDERNRWQLSLAVLNPM